MKLMYDNGPDTIKLGEYLFVKDVAQEVPDDIGKLLLRKTVVIFKKVKTNKKELIENV